MNTGAQNRSYRWIGAAALGIGAAVFTVFLGLRVVTAAGSNGQTVYLPIVTVPESGDLIRAGDLNDIGEAFATGALPAGKTHVWTITVLEDETFTVSAIAPAPADVALSISRFGQPVVAWQDAVGPGKAETIVEPVLGGEGTYEILVREVNGKAAEYALAATYQGDFGLMFMGFLTPGEPVDDVILDADLTHYWLFDGRAGDLLSFTVMPQSPADLAVDLYGPGPEYLEFFDAGVENEPEQVTDFPLKTSGLHAMAVLELNFLETSYSMEMDLK